MLELPKIILASASPRRAEILRTVGWPFETLPVNIDESRRDNEDAAGYVQRLAREKAEAAAPKARNQLIVAADTTVVIDDHILEKPLDENDARRMLRLLNNRWHQVLTGIAIIDPHSQTTIAHEQTEVKFAAMSDGQIDWYVASGVCDSRSGRALHRGNSRRLFQRRWVAGATALRVSSPGHRIFLENLVQPLCQLLGHISIRIQSAYGCRDLSSLVDDDCRGQLLDPELSRDRSIRITQHGQLVLAPKLAQLFIARIIL